MEESISLIEEQCREQIQAYMECVEENPHTWRTNCQEAKRELSICSSANPIIRFINKSCTKEFKEYNTCMIDNPNNVATCVGVLTAFNECAAKATEEYRKVVMVEK